LKEAEAGMPVKELCRKHGFSDAAFYGWRSKFGGLQVNEAKRLRELEAESAKLKKLLAEARLDVEALKVAFGKALGPQAKRQAVARMRAGVKISERHACGLMQIARSTMRRIVVESEPNRVLQGGLSI
jgi:putative transposase